MELTLSQDEYLWLFLILGYAAAAARKDQDEDTLLNILRVTNAIGRNSCNFQPLLLPEGKGE